MLKKVLLGTCCAFVLACPLIGAIPNASGQDIGISIRFGPPEPRVEYRPQARRGYTWSDGHWEWRGQRHTWVKGYWVRNRPGLQYEQVRWEQRGNRWIMHKGKWQHRSTGRDRDATRGRDDRDARDSRRD